MKRSYSSVTLLFAALASLFYSTWPLGYIVNPAVAKHGLASELGGAHQPGAWIFVYGDVLTGVLMVYVAFRLWQEIMPSPTHKALRFIILNVAGFGAATIVDALLPLGCTMSTRVCPQYNHDPLLLLHALFTVIASNCLLIVLVMLWLRSRRSPYLSALLIAFLATNLVTVIEIASNDHNNIAQHLLLSVSSLMLITFPSAISQTAKIKKQRSQYPQARVAKTHLDA